MNTNSISMTNAVASSSSNGNNSSNTTGTASETDMFMTLLVAQLKNQDPLQPQDGAAFVAQLAQFNSLDQLIGIRQSIEQLAVRLQQQGPGSGTPSPTTGR